ncbi:MAG: dTMP kinase [Elusimicrobia bacterium RIFCSPLOWO2_12_FULL_59_9]|nr:MAG: dTMP kinase [Elusimicrobia bacterium RIFCSPLOWO2_12_FULL_59_9]
MPPKGLFIVLEGPDKSGKSTQAVLLVRALRRRGLAVLHTREPGGTAMAESIRKILLDPRLRILPLTELFLYEASRVQHTAQKVRPALARGEIVVSERYTLASLAYQSYGRGIPLRTVRTLNRVATEGLSPDLTLVLDVAEEIFKERMRGKSHDRLEKEPPSFRDRVRRGYFALLKKEPRVAFIDAAGAIRKVHSRILKKLNPLLSNHRTI